MPFNMAMMGIGGRIIVLAALTAEDLALAYNVEAQIASEYPSLAPSRAADVIQLTISGDDYIAASAGGYALDADGVHDDAIFQITLLTGCVIRGRGGAGGDGGDGIWDSELVADLSTPGDAAGNGGTALRFGCETNIVGTGTIELGYAGGGGGGGGSSSFSNEFGGGGGGGGAPLGVGGSGGSSINGSGAGGSAGGTATNTADGGGGAAGGADAGAGGAGGDSAGAAASGSAGTRPGGAAGTDGDAIDSQGFTHSEGGSITVTGDII